jgi:hypothetical protein
MLYMEKTWRGTFDWVAVRRARLPWQSCFGAKDAQKMCDHRLGQWLIYHDTHGTTSASALM